MPRPLRVIHLPANVGGNPQALARAERALGLDSHAVTLEQQWFGYEVDEVLFRPDDGRLARLGRRTELLWRLARTADVVHFNFGMPLTRSPVAYEGHPWQARRLLRPLLAARRALTRAVDLLDVALLRRLGKAVFVTYQGDDARQGDECRRRFRVHPADEVEPGYYTPSGDEARRGRIRRFDAHAHGIYALNPDLLHVLPARARFMPYACVDPRSLRPEGRERGRLPRIVHAPSHRGVKGTRFVLQALQELRDEGVAFELDLVEKVSHADALLRYRAADLLVDQLLCGWYGGLAVEAMAMGVPALCYLRTEDLEFLPEAMRRQLPLIVAEPATVKAVLREWLTVRRDELSGLGAASRRFVERWHDPDAIARDLVGAYEQALR